MADNAQLLLGNGQVHEYALACRDNMDIEVSDGVSARRSGSMSGSSSIGTGVSNQEATMYVDSNQNENFSKMIETLARERADNLRHSMYLETLQDEIAKKANENKLLCGDLYRELQRMNTALESKKNRLENDIEAVKCLNELTNQAEKQVVCTKLKQAEVRARIANMLHPTLQIGDGIYPNGDPDPSTRHGASQLFSGH